MRTEITKLNRKERRLLKTGRVEKRRKSDKEERRKANKEKKKI